MTQHIDIEIDFEDESDRDAALDRIISQLKEGYRMGYDRNENSRYRFTTTIKIP